MTTPAGQTPPSGPNSTTPNATGPPTIRRKRPAASAFLEKKRPPIKKPNAAPRPPSSGHTVNGALGVAGQRPLPTANGNQNASSTAAAPQQPSQAEASSDYPVVITKSMIEQGMRYHALKFTVRPSEKGVVPHVDPYDDQHFTRPVRLHRRYARDKPETADQSDAPPGIDDKERELHNARRAERQAEREANQAQIAPSGAANKKQQPRKKNQKNVEDVYYNDNNPKQQKAAQLRYEETKPWHLEDFDNKNTWIGAYQEPMSETSVLFTVNSSQGNFTMVPIERWYKFTQTNRLQTMSAEEAEKIMEQKHAPSRWFLNTQVGKQESEAAMKKRERDRKVAERRAMKAEDEGLPAMARDAGEFYNADRDELDFEFNDEFQDDDEGMIFGDEADEAKDIERRIREEMRTANISAPGLKNTEADYDREEAQKKLDEKAQRKREKRMRKRLINKERKIEFEDDSEENEFSSESDESDSEEEREIAERERKEEEARKAAQANGDRSGASTRGTNTPSGRTEKKDPARSHASLAASLKRPGSPGLSDASGNESSRKKLKVNGSGSTSPSGMNGRSLSRKSSSRLSPQTHTDNSLADAARNRMPSGYGSGSETDTSRAGRGGKKLHLKRSAPGSPRDGTPTGSRAQSPARTGTPPVSFPSLEEVKAGIPEAGITIGDLVKLFRGRVSGKENTDKFIALVRQAGTQDKMTKKIVPLKENKA